MSEGEYISLGLNEVDDLKYSFNNILRSVIDDLRENRAAKNFMLFGHSAGKVY